MKKFRIFHGPQNFSGIAGFMANLQREHGLQSDCRIYRAKAMFPNHHENLHLERYPVFLHPFIILPFFIKCLWRYDIFHFYAGKTFFILGLDLPILKLFGKKILMTYTGSDIRLINTVEKQNNPYFHLLQFDFNSRKPNNKLRLRFLQPFKDLLVHAYNHPKFDKRKMWMMRYHNLWVDIFFTVKGNYKNAIELIPARKLVKDIMINHVGIGKLSDHPPAYNTRNDVPIVVHAPTNRSIKGSDYIISTIEKLQADGIAIDFRLIENLPNEEVKKIYRECDIVIDQLLVGDFGTLAIEGMMYGKAVACFLREDLIRDIYPDCPIYNVNIDNLYLRLKELIENRTLREQLGKEGRIYIEKYFDIEEIARDVEKIYKAFD